MVEILSGPFSGTRVLWNVDGKGVQLLWCEHGSEAKLCPCPVTFKYLYGLGIRQSWTSHCRALIDNTTVSILVSADTVILDEVQETLIMALKALHEELEPLGLKVFWGKAKVQEFAELLDETVQSVHTCGKDTDIKF